MSKEKRSDLERVSLALEALNMSLFSIKEALQSLELLERCKYFCLSKTTTQHSLYCDFEDEALS